MPLYSFLCHSCTRTLDDILCTYEEAQQQHCPECDQLMKLKPSVFGTVWNCDTEFSSSKKVIKE